MDKELPLTERERRQNRIRYYQWVPFLLLFQAILFYIPRIIWRTLNVRSGLDLVNLVDAAIKYESVDKFGDREKIMEYLTRNIERYIGARRSRYERLYGTRNYHKPKHNRSGSKIAQCWTKFWSNTKIALSTMCFWTGKRLGNYLVVLYMFVKTLWLTNAISQLFLLNRFIGNDYHAFGIEIIEMLLTGQEWNELRHFPRVTYCDFKIREIGNNHDWTVQCVLRINLFNEVIYIFMWFWLCILALCSFADYLNWTFKILVPGDKLRFIKRHLDIYNYYSPTKKNRKTDNDMGNFEFIDVEKEKRLMREFTFKYLKDDGVFAMRILASSASDLIITEVISELWKNFKNNYSECNEDLTIMSSPSSSSSSASASSPNSTGQKTSPTLVKKPLKQSVNMGLNQHIAPNAPEDRKINRESYQHSRHVPNYLIDHSNNANANAKDTHV